MHFLYLLPSGEVYGSPLVPSAIKWVVTKVFVTVSNSYTPILSTPLFPEQVLPQKPRPVLPLSLYFLKEDVNC